MTSQLSKRVLQRLLVLFTSFALILPIGQIPASATSLPALGSGSGEVSVRLGTVHGSPGMFNTQFVVGGGNAYTFPVGTAQGSYAAISVGYSIGSNPHSMAIYAGNRPGTIGGGATQFLTVPNSGSFADISFTPSAGATGIVACWTLNYYATAGTATLITVCSANSDGPASAGSSAPTPAPAKYSGPEFSGLSAKPVAVGASSVLEGKRLNEVSSITIGGKSATFTATATELKLNVPKDLAPGLYDLVINSSAGKLTQINAVRVQGPRTSLSVTTVSEGRISSEQLHEHALIAAMQQPELTKARCIVNGPNLAQAKAQAERLCALVKASNKNIETTVVESRSTVKNNKVYARVSYGWN